MLLRNFFFHVRLALSFDFWRWKPYFGTYFFRIVYKKPPFLRESDLATATLAQRRSIIVRKAVQLGFLLLCFQPSFSRFFGPPGVNQAVSELSNGSSAGFDIFFFCSTLFSLTFDWFFFSEAINQQVFFSFRNMPGRFLISPFTFCEQSGGKQKKARYLVVDLSV